MYVSRSSPRPPYSSGIAMPNSPSAFICSTMASGNASACSISEATGITSRSMKRRTVSISSRRISGSVDVVMSGTLRERRVRDDFADRGDRYRDEPMMHWSTLQGFRRDEALRGRKLNRETLRRVLTWCAPYKRPLIGFIVAVVVDAIVMVIPAQLVKVLIDHALPPLHHNRRLVAVIALVAVGLAIADAVLSLVQRYLSSRVGEGLIYDLRVALFDHVQRMPLAFFTRTQTGSLQSRLNNDVIGAQQAVTSTLGTVVSNVISLAVVLTVMFKMEWRLTLLTLIVLPAFVIPARRLGPRMQHLTRQGMQLNAEMNNLTVERFNVAGALLAKLFGRRDTERDRFSVRAAGVRDIGVRTAIYGRILFVALGLVAAVGTAVVYFVGG